MADKKKTGIFGGAFNPIHKGHISIAKGFLKSLELDRIIFIPTAEPPHKSNRFLASKEDRLNMLSLALGDNKAFEISQMEFEREGKSYTYDTLCLLKEKYPSDKFYLIIGADQILTFNRWYRYDDIISLADICAAAREDDSEKKRILEFVSTLEKLDKNRFHLLQNDVIKVSSSLIREKIKAGEDISSLVDDDVYKYILDRGLYRV